MSEFQNYNITIITVILFLIFNSGQNTIIYLQNIINGKYVDTIIVHKKKILLYEYII